MQLLNHHADKGYTVRWCDSMGETTIGTILGSGWTKKKQEQNQTALSRDRSMFQKWWVVWEILAEVPYLCGLNRHPGMILALGEHSRVDRYPSNWWIWWCLFFSPLYVHDPVVLVRCYYKTLKKKKWSFGPFWIEGLHVFTADYVHHLWISHCHLRTYSHQGPY